MNPLVSAEELLLRVKRLPVLPRAALALGEALRDEGVPVARVVEIVGSDAALTLAALRLANSSFYGVSGRVATLRDAVHVLGTQTLASAVMTAAVVSCFDEAGCPGFDTESCWRHALATALCAQALARKRGLDPELAYTAGLLHDLGQLVLACYFPQAFSATLERAQAQALQPVVAERELMGLDHAVVGGLIARHWQLPSTLADAVRLHHEAPAAPATPQHGPQQGRQHAGANDLLPEVLRLAEAVTHAFDRGHEAGAMLPPSPHAAAQHPGLDDDELQALLADVRQRMQGLGRIGR